MKGVRLTWSDQNFPSLFVCWLFLRPCDSAVLSAHQFLLAPVLCFLDCAWQPDHGTSAQRPPCAAAAGSRERRSPASVGPVHH